LIKRFLKLSEELTDSLSAYLNNMNEENLKILKEKNDNMILYIVGVKAALK